MTMQPSAVLLPAAATQVAPRRIVITGYRGQLGRALQAAFPGDMRICMGRPECDITNPDIVPSVVSWAPDIVLHAAAYTDVDGAEADPEAAFRVNALGAQHLALACRQCAAVLVYVSTNEVFDGCRSDSAYYEWEETHPLSVYARSKAAGEKAVLSLSERAYIVRVAWLFARGGSNFPRKILDAAAKHGALRVVADEWGNPTYAPDAAQAIARLVERAHYGIYHLTNQGVCSRYEFACEILRQAGYGDVPVTPIRAAEWVRPSTPPRRAILANSQAAALGIYLRPWQETLADYLKP